MSYSNPVSYTDGRLYTAPDPFVLRFRGAYYAYSSGSKGVGLSVSTDLVRWTRLASPYHENGRKNYWAPSVIYLDGVFYMYVSDMPAGEDDTHTEILRVARSTSPTGPFEFVCELFDTFSIDSQVVRLQDGSLVLFYADNQVAGLDRDFGGTSVMCDVLRTPVERVGRPKPVIVPSNQDELFQKNRFGDGRDWYTVEGPTFLTHHGESHVTYSGNSYLNKDYFVGWSQAEGIPAGGDGLSALRWEKQLTGGHVTPLIRSDRGISGTGHNSITVGPSGVDPWIVYHGRATERLSRDDDAQLPADGEDRVMCIDPLFFREPGLFTPAPSDTGVFPPFPVGQMLGQEDDPDTTDRQGGSVGSGLDHAGRVVALSAQGNPLLLSDPGLPTSAYRLDFWIRARTSPLGCRFGVLLAYYGPDEQTRLVIDAGTGSFRIEQRCGGITSITLLPCHLSVSVRQRLSWGDWHHLTVDRGYSHFVLSVDGMTATEGYIAPGPAQAGIFTDRTDVRLSAVALTDHVDLWGGSLRDITQEVTTGTNLLVCRDACGWAVRPRGGQAHFSIGLLPDDAAMTMTISPSEEGADRRFTLVCGQMRLDVSDDTVVVDVDGGAPVRRHSAASDGLTVCLRKGGGYVRIITSAGGAPVTVRCDGPSIMCGISGFDLRSYERTGRLVCQGGAKK